MASRRRRSSIELEVQVNVPAVDPSVDAVQTSRPGSIAGLADVGGVEQQLEAADGGAAAWRILYAAFMFEAVLFGEDLSILHPMRLVDGRFTYCIESRLLGLIWCFPELLYKAPRIRGQSIYTYSRDNGIWHIISWRPRNGRFCQALSTLSPLYYLGRLAAVYPRTYRWVFCE